MIKLNSISNNIINMIAKIIMLTSIFTGTLSNNLVALPHVMSEILKTGYMNSDNCDVMIVSRDNFIHEVRFKLFILTTNSIANGSVSQFKLEGQSLNPAVYIKTENAKMSEERQ